MEFEDDAFVLSARPHGETGAIVEMLTATRGRWAAHVAGGASRRMRPMLQAGARVLVRYRARTSDQLGSATLEAGDSDPSILFDDPAALAGLSAAAAVTAAALPEREAHPGAFLAFEALVSALAIAPVSPWGRAESTKASSSNSIAAYWGPFRCRTPVPRPRTARGARPSGRRP